MTARLYCNVVYAWLMGSCQGDPDARADMESRIYASAQGAEVEDARIWAAIMSAED
jgi:hypothetical protein